MVDQVMHHTGSCWVTYHPTENYDRNELIISSSNCMIIMIILT